MPHRTKRAFTLIELSIVLVIIGLIVGGVLVGRDLIKAAELRSVITQRHSFTTAVATFQGKYSALPGDLINATTYWGIAGGNGSDNACKTAISTTSATCDGNGNGRIGDLMIAGEHYEMHRFWQHLANAGLIEGRYSGVSADGGAGGVLTSIGTNAPNGKFGNLGWSVSHLTNYPGDGGWYALDYGNHLIVGSQWSGEYTQGKGFRSQDALSIDKKIDDGKPGRGRMVGLHYASCTSSSSNADLDGDYLASTTAPQCALVFVHSF